VDYEEPELVQEEERHSWRITHPAEADWAGSKLVAAQQQQAENRETARLRKAQIDHWLETENKKLEDRDVTFFSKKLEQWHRGLLLSDPKRKTIKLPFVVLKAREQREILELPDEDACIAYAEENKLDSCITIKKSANKNELKKHINATGEVIPGAKLVQPTELKYTVSINDPIEIEEETE
jgi:hypothetical protein